MGRSIRSTALEIEPHHRLQIAQQQISNNQTDRRDRKAADPADTITTCSASSNWKLSTRLRWVIGQGKSIPDAAGTVFNLTAPRASFRWRRKSVACYTCGILPLIRVSLGLC